MTNPIFWSAFLVGLAGAGHCIGMCGGISSALAFGVPKEKRSQTMLFISVYNLGRISAYALAGALIGLLGANISDALGGHGPSVLRILAGVFMVLMGAYVAGWWRLLTRLERGGSFLWRYIQPLSQRFFPVKTLWSALALGALWGWLPCGLVYSALVLAMSQSSVTDSMGVMAAFGLGTLPALIISGMAADHLKQVLAKQGVRQIMGIMVIAFGIWTAVLPLSMRHADGHSSGSMENHPHHSEQAKDSDYTEEQDGSGHHH